MAVADSDAATGSTTNGKAKGRRGRKQDDSLPPSRSRDMQRAFRARKAQHVTDLENRVARLEAENKDLRARLGMPPRLPTPPHSTSPPALGGTSTYSGTGSHAAGDEGDAETPSEADVMADTVETSPVPSPAVSAATIKWPQSGPDVKPIGSPVRSPLPPTPAVEHVRMSFPPISPIASIPTSHAYPPPVSPAVQSLDLLAHAANPAAGYQQQQQQQPSLPSFFQSSNGYPPQSQPFYQPYASYTQQQSHASMSSPVVPLISAPPQHQSGPAFRPIKSPSQSHYTRPLLSHQQQQEAHQPWRLQHPQHYYPMNGHTGPIYNVQSSDPAAHAHSSSTPSSASAMMCRPTADCCPASPPPNGLHTKSEPPTEHYAGAGTHPSQLANGNGPGLGSANDALNDSSTSAEAAEAAATTLTTLESLIPYEPRLLPARPPSPTFDVEQLFLSLYVPDAAVKVSPSATSYRSFVLALMRGLEWTNKGPCGRVSYSAEEEMQLCTPAGETCCGGLLDCAAASIAAARDDAEHLAERTRRSSESDGGESALVRKEGWSRPREVWEALLRANAYYLNGRDDKSEDQVDGRMLAEWVLEHCRPDGEQPGLVSRNVRCETACGLVVADETVRELLQQIEREGIGRQRTRRKAEEDDSLQQNQQVYLEGKGGGGGEPPRKMVCCGPNRTC